MWTQMPKPVDSSRRHRRKNPRAGPEKCVRGQLLALLAGTQGPQSSCLRGTKRGKVRGLTETESL